MLFIFTFFSTLILIKSNDFEQICQILNQNGAVCSYSCDLQSNLSAYNLTNIRIILNDHSVLGNTSFQNLTIDSLTIKQNHMNVEQIVKISSANYINQLIFENILNLDYILNDKSINLLKNKINSVHLIQIVKTNEYSIINLFKTSDGLGIKSVKLSNIGVSTLSLDFNIFFNIIETSFMNCEIGKIKLILNSKIKKIVLNTLGMENLNILQLKNESRLEKISIENSRLSFVNFPVLKNLKFLSIHRNRWKKIESTTFANLTSLEELGIRSNLISQIEPDSFFFLKKLNHLNLADNLLNENIKINGPYSLKILDLSSNNFTRFSSTINLNNTPILKRLILTRNKIEYIYIDMPFLDSLELGSNKLKIIDFISGSKLDFYSNEIIVSKLVLKNIPQIDSIDLAHNLIKDLSPNDLLTFQNASSINLSNNLLKNIQFPFLYNLKFLIIVNNYLTIIDKYYFSNLTELFELNLSRNQISILKLDCFQHNTKLKILNLANNAIKTLPDLSFLVNLVNLKLDNQNSSFVLEKNSFENFHKSKSQLQISIKNNQILKINPQAFCSKNFKNIKILFDQINQYPRCIFKQMIERNVTLEISGQFHCEIKTMFTLYKIPANFLNKICDKNIQPAEDCSHEVNLKFRCSNDIDSFEFQIYQILPNYTCQSNGITYCIKNEYLNIICYLSNNSISKVKLEIFDRKIQIIEFSSGSMFFYHHYSDTVFLIKKLDDFISIYMKATKYFYEKINNYLENNDEFCVQKFSVDLKENYLKNFIFDTTVNLSQIAIQLKNEIFTNQTFVIRSNNASKIYLKLFILKIVFLINFIKF